MKTHRLQAAFARKREAEHIRTERTAAVDRYYTHWGKVTSRFENWTTPEYYEQTKENLRKSKDMKQKEEQLKVRQEKLRQMLKCEKLTFDEQLEDLRRPKSRSMSSDIMEKIDQNFKAKQEERRRLELEAKLYGRWRHGIDDEGLLYESKSDHQALAKLNWLDKQIQDQVQREQEEKIAQEQTLRLQKEVRKTQQHHKERQEIREKEIKEMRALQEKHMQELKQREEEAEALKAENNYLQNSIDQLNTELTNLDFMKSPEYEEASLSHNLRKVKMTIRKRSAAFRDQLQSDINLLKRANKICGDEFNISRLIGKLEQQQDIEMQNIAQIEGMYESEAKVNLNQREDTWRQLNFERRLDLKNLLRDLQKNMCAKFYENQQRQKDLIDIRATHLSSIENSNEQLKMLIKEREDNPLPQIIETPRSAQDQPSKALQKVNDSFTNLNLDCLGGTEVESQPKFARSISVVPSDLSLRPKFGRKRVAWI